MSTGGQALEISNTVILGDRVDKSAVCLDDGICGESSSSSSSTSSLNQLVKAFSHGRSMGGDTESVTRGSSNASQREKGLVMRELWGEVPAKTGSSGLASRYSLEDDVELVKAKALTQHFQKLKGELVEALVDRQEKPDELTAGWEKNDPESPASYADFLGQSLGTGKHEIKLSRLLCEQLKILADREKAVEKRLSMERMEHIVEKVEEEVELEEAMEELLLRMKADEEVMEIQRQEREWEIERREVQFEEQIMLLKSRVRRLEEELTVTQAEKEYALQKKQEEMDEVIRGMLVELREGDEDLTRSKCNVRSSCRAFDLVHSASDDRPQKQVNSPSKDLFIAFEELLKDADERTEKERKSLEDVTAAKQESEERFQHERRRWREKDKQNELRILALEKEVEKLSGVLRENDKALISERERRKECRLEMDRTMDIWRGETKRQLVTTDKIRRLESVLAKVKRTVSNGLQCDSPADGHRDILSNLQILLESPEAKTEDGYAGLSTRSEEDRELNDSVAAHLTQMLVDRNRVETERDDLEEKMSSFVHRAREREKELEDAWFDKEKAFVSKLGSLEAESEELQLQRAKMEIVIRQERKNWEQESESWKKKWLNEKQGWEAMVREREQWVEVQVEKWTCLLQEREAELASMREEQKKLLEAFEANKQRLGDMKQQVVSTRKGFQKEFPRKNPSLEDNEESCNSSEVSSAVSKRQDDSSSQNFIDVERLATEMEAEIKRMTREVRLKEERLEKERLELKSGSEQLKQEKQVLEQKVCDIESVLEGLKAEMQTKEILREAERKQMQETIAMKMSEIKKLESQIDFGEHEMERGEQQIELLSREVERERRRKEQEVELTLTLQTRLREETNQREEACSKMTAANQQIDALRVELDLKNKALECFEDEAKQKEQVEIEKKTWIERAKEEELKMAKAISNLMTEKSELFESRHRNQVEYEKNVNELRSEILELRKAVQKHEGHGKTRGAEVMAGLMKPDLETLWLDYSENRASVDKRAMEWEVAVERVADFEKQISDAMLAIQSLREELGAKEIALAQSRMEREAELERREQIWAQEQQEVAKLQDQLREADRQRAAIEKEELMTLLEAQKEESGAVTSALQGAVKELQWCLKHGKRDHLPDFSNLMRNDMVLVHASHLEEVDSFVRTLKLKLEESENLCKAAEAAVSSLEREKAARLAEVDAALLQMEKDLAGASSESKSRQLFASPFPEKGSLSPARLDGGFDNFRKRARGSSNMGIYASRPSEKPMLLTSSGQSQQDWTAGSSEQFGRSMDMDASSVTSASNTWLPRQDDSWVFEQDKMALAVNSSVPPRRRQQKWLVDAGWLDRVRKEQALLRQQLEMERQRTFAIEQIEAENKWMETVVARALEQKKESDMKVHELELRVIHLDSIIAGRGGSCSSQQDQ